MSGEGLELLEQRLTLKKAAGKVGFDPMTILTIISALLPLIANCFNPKPAALRRRIGNRVLVASALRKADQSLTFAKAFAQADELFDLADAAKDSELQMLIDDCR